MTSSSSSPTERSPSTSSPAARGHELRPHTADAAICAWAPTLTTLLEEAAAGLAELSADVEPEAVPPNGPRRERVEVRALDLDALVVAWLNELIALVDIHGALTGTRVEEAARDAPGGEWRLRAEATLVPFDGRLVRRRDDVKSATYHRLAVRQGPSGAWALDCIVDV
jgi:SHS2 domain-containing protein